MAKKKSKKKLQKEKLMYLYIALFVIASVYVGVLFYNSVAYENKIYPGVNITGIDVGGKTKEEAKGLITKKIKEKSQSVILRAGKTYQFNLEELGISYDAQKTVNNAYEVGRDDDFNPTKHYNQEIPVAINIDHDKFMSKFFEITENENVSVEDAEIFMRSGKLKTTQENIGKRVLLGENIETIKNGLEDFHYNFDLKVKDIQPNVTQSDITSAEKQIQDVLSRKITLKGADKNYSLTEKDITSFISFENSGSRSSVVYNFSLNNLFPSPAAEDSVDITFDRASIRDWAVSFSGTIDRNPKNAKLAGSGGQVEVIADSVDGQKVKVDELVNKMKDALDNAKNEVEIPSEVTKPEVSSDNLAKLGLKQLVSTGWTDFSGSPHNREVNISVGASKFNGVLVKPGENFSFDDTLGPVEAYTGYLPELVIKKDKTVPEYGGGLCQVSSTAFRAALNAGLPILERSAHAYPVGYYKPFGVDATIYLPSPDLVFKNDTPGYILIQTRIIGKKLYFDFYGTKKDITLKFAGNQEGTVGASDLVEGITPTITEQEARGEGSFTAEFYRLMYDASGKLIKTNNWISRYDSPKKYPH